MKILIDINHPAHVHYFKNFIKIMENKGHSFLILSRNKEFEHYLLKKYNIPFEDRGKGGKTTLQKIIYFFYATIFLIIKIKNFKPDIVISFGTPYPAIAALFFPAPHISINDTEHAKLHHLLTDTFSKVILTPSCYNKDLGSKQIKFDGFMELSYLNPKYFNPDISIYDLIGLKSGERYIVLRFVSWDAIHDKGYNGFSIEDKRKLINELSKYIKVLISSESILPEDLSKYKLKIPAEKMHDLLAFSSLFVGEGATMASESVLLGTPAIYINELSLGYIEEQKKSGMVFQINNVDEVIKKSLEILDSYTSNFCSLKLKEILINKIDVTEFFVWFFDNYPSSIKKEYKNYSYKLSRT